MQHLLREVLHFYLERGKTHGRWLRMILTLAIRAISRAEKLPSLPVTFILDEMGTISPGSGLSMIEQSYGLMAGLGIRIWAFLQDLPQLQRDYPDSWETFISNSSVIQLLNVADNTTAKYFSEYLGNNTMNAKTGEWLLKEHQYPPGTDFQAHLFRTAAQYLMDIKYSHDWPDAEKWIRHVFAGNAVKGEPVTAVQWARDRLNRKGYTEQSFREWTEDTQLMSRPVMFPWELVSADQNKCVLIMPGLWNFQLNRIVYYNDPYLSKLARPDPNRQSR